MQIKLKNILSLRNAMDITLRPINFFTGESGSGKSVLSDFIQLFKHNAYQQELLKKHLPRISKFDDKTDWKNWVTNGDLSQETIVTRSVAFLGKRALVKVKLGCLKPNKNVFEERRYMAELNSFIVQDGQNILVNWSKEERVFYNKNIAIYLLKAIKNHEEVPKKQWDDLLGFTSRYSGDLSMALISEYIKSEPYSFTDDMGCQEFFYMDLGQMFFRHRFSIRHNPKFESVLILMEKVLVQFQKEMNQFLVDSFIINGESRPLRFQGLSKEKNKYAMDYFGFSFVHKKVKLENGAYLGQELFIKSQGREDWAERFGMGYRMISGWIDQWREVVVAMEREKDSVFFSPERLVFVLYPERYLSSQWQRQLFRMMADDALRFPSLKLIFITNSEEGIRAASDGLSQGFVNRNSVAVFKFKWEEGLQTTVMRMRQTEWTKELGKQTIEIPRELPQNLHSEMDLTRVRYLN